MDIGVRLDEGAGNRQWIKNRYGGKCISVSEAYRPCPTPKVLTAMATTNLYKKAQ